MVSASLLGGVGILAADSSTAAMAFLAAAVVVLALVVGGCLVWVVHILRGMASFVRVYVLTRETGHIEVLRPGMAVTETPTPRRSRPLMEPEDDEAEETVFANQL